MDKIRFKPKSMFIAQVAMWFEASYEIDWCFPYSTCICNQLTEQIRLWSFFRHCVTVRNFNCYR